MDNRKLETATNWLEYMFADFNRVIFGDTLEKPLILIQTNLGKKYMGWCSRKRVWKTANGDVEMYEITVCPEYLNRGINDLADTMLHEMVHLYHMQNGIKDCSDAGIHNKKFKKEAESRGLKTCKGPKGWTTCGLESHVADIVAGWGVPADAFDFLRVSDKEAKPEKPKTVFKYTCKCGVMATAKKGMPLVCGRCNEPMKMEDDEDEIDDTENNEDGE